jgi:phosphomannomutase
LNFQNKETMIKFGTDGWRAIIAQDYTVDNVARVSEATAKWLLRHSKTPSAVVGFDCRFGGELFAETVAKVFVANGIKVWACREFVSTPMISLGTILHKADLGIIITASHNPPSYNGYKIKGSYGGPLTPELVQEIEDMIPAHAAKGWQDVSLTEGNNFSYTDLEDAYIKHVEKSFDLAAIRKSGLRFGYDAMFGAGQRVMKKLFPEIDALHCDHNPGFHGQAPEPIDKNLQEFSSLIRSRGDIDCGLATDGDADRLGLYDSKGNFVDSHHIILLLINYLVKYKKMTGKVVVAFSVSNRIRKMCAHFNLPVEVVKIGFKNICSIMVKEDVLLGGEESGGIAIKGHIPERDGVWIGLTIWEFMARTGKSLQDLINDVYSITGPFFFDRNDLHIDEAIKLKVLAACKSGGYKEFGSHRVQRTDDLDGYKFFFSDDTWIMIRASGTEPVLRVYVEASDRKSAEEILTSARKVLLS